MKKYLKAMSVVLALVMCVGVFTSCGEKEKAVSTDDLGTFTYWASMYSSSAQTLTSYSEMLMYQEIAKATGIDVEFIHPAKGSTGTEAFQILIASGDVKCSAPNANIFALLCILAYLAVSSS